MDFRAMLMRRKKPAKKVVVVSSKKIKILLFQKYAGFAENWIVP